MTSAIPDFAMANELLRNRILRMEDKKPSRGWRSKRRAVPGRSPRDTATGGSGSEGLGRAAAGWRAEIFTAGASTDAPAPASATRAPAPAVGTAAAAVTGRAETAPRIEPRRAPGEKEGMDAQAGFTVRDQLVPILAMTDHCSARFGASTSSDAALVSRRWSRRTGPYANSSSTSSKASPRARSSAMTTAPCS